MPSPDLPLVSCLTVTDGRFGMLERAIRCFADQTWPAKELVIVSQGAPEYRRQITARRLGYERPRVA